MIRSNLCDYSDAYILVSGAIEITGAGADDTEKRADERNKGVIFKNQAPFTECINEINDTQLDNVKDVDVVMPTYSLIEYSDNYSKTSVCSLQYYRDEPANTIQGPESFKSKIRIAGNISHNGNKKNIEILVPLKYLSILWRTLEMPLRNCEISLILTWSENFVISSATGKRKSALKYTKLYVPIVTLSTPYDIKLLNSLHPVFKEQLTGIDISLK